MTQIKYDSHNFFNEVRAGQEKAKKIIVIVDKNQEYCLKLDMGMLPDYIRDKIIIKN